MPADRRGTFRHGLKHGRLRFGIRTVDLVQQYEIGVNRTDLVENFCDGKSNTWVPTRSDGMRSGVHCTRLNEPIPGGERLGGRGLAKPGTDSIKNMPPATKVTISDSRRFS